MTLILHFIEERKNLMLSGGNITNTLTRDLDSQTDLPLSMIEKPKLKRGRAAIMIDEGDGPLVRGPDVATLLELQKENERKRKGRLAGTRSRVFEDAMGGRENI